MGKKMLFLFLHLFKRHLTEVKIITVWKFIMHLYIKYLTIAQSLGAGKHSVVRYL
jgi:hypothetical protein